jgi:mycoredoxin
MLSAGSRVVSIPEEIAAPVDVEVFWRPGCPYCSSLRSDLSRRGVVATWRNIWEDEGARARVRASNSGNETVPTVRVGAQVLTNPSGARVAKLAGLPDGESESPRAGGLLIRSLLSWTPTIALVVTSEVLARSGHSEISWGIDVLAIAAWWFTRPLRR